MRFISLFLFFLTSKMLSRVVRASDNGLIAYLPMCVEVLFIGMTGRDSCLVVTVSGAQLVRTDCAPWSDDQLCTWS